MERVIKFRFRLKLIVDEWGTYKRNNIDTFFISLLGDDNGLVRFPIDKRWEIISCDLFTGLLDKGGKEIYENDLVKFHYFFQSLGENFGVQESEHELTGVVKWGAFGWGISAIKGEHWKGYTGYEDGEGESSFMDLMAMNESGVHEESFEIIGNLYQTPELITS